MKTSGKAQIARNRLVMSAFTVPLIISACYSILDLEKGTDTDTESWRFIPLQAPGIAECKNGQSTLYIYCAIFFFILTMVLTRKNCGVTYQYLKTKRTNPIAGLNIIFSGIIMFVIPNILLSYLNCTNYEPEKNRLILYYSKPLALVFLSPAAVGAGYIIMLGICVFIKLSLRREDQ